jgi:hypothetical protein
VARGHVPVSRELTRGNTFVCAPIWASCGRRDAMAWRALAFSASGTLSSMSGTSTSTAHRGEGRELFQFNAPRAKGSRPEGTRQGHVAFLLEHLHEHVLPPGHKQPTAKRWGGGDEVSTCPPRMIEQKSNQKRTAMSSGPSGQQPAGAHRQLRRPPLLGTSRQPHTSPCRAPCSLH